MLQDIKKAVEDSIAFFYVCLMINLYKILSEDKSIPRYGLHKDH